MRIHRHRLSAVAFQSIHPGRESLWIFCKMRDVFSIWAPYSMTLPSLLSLHLTVARASTVWRRNFACRPLANNRWRSPLPCPLYWTPNPTNLWQFLTQFSLASGLVFASVFWTVVGGNLAQRSMMHSILPFALTKAVYSVSLKFY